MHWVCVRKRSLIPLPLETLHAWLGWYLVLFSFVKFQCLKMLYLLVKALSWEIYFYYYYYLSVCPTFIKLIFIIFSAVKLLAIYLIICIFLYLCQFTFFDWYLYVTWICAHFFKQVLLTSICIPHNVQTVLVITGIVVYTRHLCVTRYRIVSTTAMKAIVVSWNF